MGGSACLLDFHWIKRIILTADSLRDRCLAELTPVPEPRSPGGSGRDCRNGADTGGYANDYGNRIGGPGEDVPSLAQV